jgi:hypothetical protein
MTDLQLAVAAHQGTSFVPEQRGEQAHAELVRFLAEVESETRAAFPTLPADVVTQQVERFRAGYLRRWRAWMGAKSRCLSPMITGPSNFPTRRNEKANNSEHNRLTALLSYEQRGQAAMRRILARMAAPAADDAAAAELAKLEKQLAAMKFVNGLLRRTRTPLPEKVAAVVAELGVSEATATTWLTAKDCFGRVGFPGYELTSVRGKIERLRAKVRTFNTTPAESQAVGGVEVVEDVADDRLRLIFPDKPSEDVRDLLKRNGFRWSPANGAWQRQLTENARVAARLLLAKLACNA